METSTQVVCLFSPDARGRAVIRSVVRVSPCESLFLREGTRARTDLLQSFNKLTFHRHQTPRHVVSDCSILAEPSPRERLDPFDSCRLKPHSHDPIPNAGSFKARRPRITRDYRERAFTVGIGGPVGTGKTALMLSLCRHFRESYSVAAITNDIFTREDGEFLVRHEALDAGRIRAVETGGCPHAAIREDISCNLTEVEALTAEYAPDFILLESGGDNLAANFSRELADFIVYVIDVCGGDKIPRKGGPGVTQADLLIINKVELAQAVGANLEVMVRSRLYWGKGASKFTRGLITPSSIFFRHLLLPWPTFPTYLLPQRWEKPRQKVNNDFVYTRPTHLTTMKDAYFLSRKKPNLPLGDHDPIVEMLRDGSRR